MQSIGHTGSLPAIPAPPGTWLSRRRDRLLTQLRSQSAERLAELDQDHTEQFAKFKTAGEARLQAMAQRAKQLLASTQEQYTQAKWVADSVGEGGVVGAATEYRVFKEKLNKRLEALTAKADSAAILARRLGFTAPPAPPPPDEHDPALAGDPGATVGRGG